MTTLYTTDSFTKIYYHTSFATHSHTIPTRTITTLGLGDPGTLESWNGDPIPADTMVKTLMDKLGEAVPSTTLYDKFVLYRWNIATLEYNPVYEEAYSVTGSAAGLTGQAKAVQVTVTHKTLGFSFLKLVFLDRPNNNTWGNQIPTPADYTEIVAEITSLDNAWSGRDNTRPAFSTGASASLNKRLRRKYGMI